MNRMEKALKELSDMDSLAALDSPIHRLHPAAKLLCTVVYILTVVSFDKYDLTRLFPLILWPVFLFQIAGISVRTCFYKLRIVLPIILAVGLFNPLFDRAPLFYAGGIAVSGGVVSMLTLMLKGVLSLMASFILIATTQIDRMCASLRALHFPEVLVTLLLLTYRYAGLMTKELSVMTDAYHLRAPGQKGIHISAWGSFLGQLLLRSMDRAQDLYTGMLLRGYHGHFHYVPQRAFGPRDAAFLAAGAAFSLLLRVVDVTRIIGGAIL